MQTEENIFLQLIRLGLSTETYSTFPTLSPEQWRTVCSIAGRQSMYGILLSGIEILPDDKRPPRDILLRLLKINLDIEQKNRLINQKVEQLFRHYVTLGFTPILLKGQGVATFYPMPHRRMPGDIDLWLTQSPRKVRAMMKKERPEAERSHHHVHYQDGSIDVEIHTIPAYMLNPFSDRRLQKYISRWKCQCRQVTLPDTGTVINIPSDGMNLIFLLLHKYRHMLLGGIGLRQMTDYMMFLRRGISPEERERAVATIRDLRLTTFCGAVMYVLSHYLGLESQYLLMEPDSSAGRHLMDEILSGGNFGQYDTRDRNPYTHGSFRSFMFNNKVASKRFAGEYSSEIRWLPVNKIYNKIWRMLDKISL